MKTIDVLRAMEGGALLHLGFEDGERVWWVTVGRRSRVSPSVAAAVLRDSRIKADADNLLPGAEPQTWSLTRAVAA